MVVRRTVGDFVSLGPLPDESSGEATIAQYQSYLVRIEPPVTDDEAALLVGSFGPDDCYGLAWTLVHLIESAPSGSPIRAEPATTSNEWLRRLWRRSQKESRD
jgi:hypothetical protein